MKIRLILSLCLFFLLISSCDKDSNPALDEKAVNQQLITSETWTLQSLTIDGIDESLLYTGLTLHFTDTEYTVTNGEPVWPKNGTWAFNNDTGTSILRDGNVLLTLTEITEDKLVIKLQWDHTTFTQGRITSIRGEQVFTFIN